MRSKLRAMIVLVMVGGLGVLAANSGSAAPRSWTGLASPTWENPGNWNPVGFVQTSDSLIFGDIVPDAESQIFSSSTFANPITIANLDLQNQAILRNGSDTWLTVTDTTTLADQSNIRNVKLRTKDLTLMGTSVFENRHGLEIQNLATIHPFATLAFDPGFDLSAEFKLTQTSGTALVNNGTITVDRILTIDAGGGGLLDLDGLTENGRILLHSTSSDGPIISPVPAHLTVNGTLADAFDGVLDLVCDGVNPQICGTTLSMLEGWTLGPNGVLNTQGGTINGGAFTMRGTINLQDFNQIDVPTNLLQGTIEDVDIGRDGQLRFTAPVTFGSGGPLSIIGTQMELEAASTVTGADLTLDSSNLTFLSAATLGGGSQAMLRGGSLEFQDVSIVDTTIRHENSGSFYHLGELTVGAGADVDVAYLQSNGPFTMNSGLVRASTYVKDENASFDFRGGDFYVDSGVALFNSSIAFSGPDPLAQPRLFIENGADATVTYGFRVGERAGEYGSATIRGVEGDRRSMLRGTGGGGGADLHVGRFGSGNFTVEDGGFAKILDDTIVATEADSFGVLGVLGTHEKDDGEIVRAELDVTGRGTQSNLDVGRGGWGILSLGQGGLVRVAGNTTAGTLPGSKGEIYVFTEENGVPAELDTSGSLTLGSQGEAALYLYDGGLVKANQINVGPGGRIDQQGGKLQANGFNKDAAAPFDLTGGTFEITGGDATFNSSFAFGGASTSGGSTDFLAGADASVTHSWKIANDADSWAQTIVAGTNADGSRRSTLRNTGGGGGADLLVGNAGNGYLSITDGGLVDFADDTILANQAGSFGSTTVMGVNQNRGVPMRSELRVQRRGNQSVLEVGRGGDGDLNVLFGGLATVAGNVSIATLPGSIGDVYVSGEAAGIPAELHVAEEIIVGPGGNGGLHLEPGGKISARTLQLGPTGTVNISGGQLIVNTLDTGPFGSNFHMTDGTLQVSSVLGDLTFADGTLTRGAALDELYVSGDYDQGNDARLLISLGADNAYDYLTIEGMAHVDGILDIQLVDSFMPSLGDDFSILDADNRLAGRFDSILTPALPAGLEWDSYYDDTSLTLFVVSAITPILPGDFDQDGDTDAQDLVRWQRDYGVGGSDADEDGDTDGNDFLAWQRHYTGSQGALATVAAVPEPASLLLMLSGLTAIALRRTR